jgi:hypothetical protein
LINIRSGSSLFHISKWQEFLTKPVDVIKNTISVKPQFTIVMIHNSNRIWLVASTSGWRYQVEPVLLRFIKK